VVLIFGWGGGPVQDGGEVAPVRCPNCHNDVFLHKIRSTKQVSLFFIPVMPYRTDEYLVCPVCRNGLQIPLGHQSAINAMRGATMAFRAGQITEPDYRARADAFWRTLGVALPIASLTGDRGTGGAPAPARAAPVDAPLADRLAGLARLHADGILTDDEFVAAKRNLLER
jgi:uncharacterized protein YbaR (Trm112 family)